MAVTGTRTNTQLITGALRKAGLISVNETASTEDAAEGLELLNFMLKAWQNKGMNLWTKASGTLTLTTATSYDLSPVRPLRILRARVKRSGVEIPMQVLTRDEYDELPVKTTTGIPTQFYYDRQREAAKFYVWPVLGSVGGETVEYTYEREIEDAELGDVADVPGEWWQAVVNNLALELCASYNVPPSPLLVALAALSLDDALGFDREESVFFGDDD